MMELISTPGPVGGAAHIVKNWRTKVILMVRTTLSFCVLFGFLIAGFAVLNQPSQKSSPTGQTPAATPAEESPRIATREA